MKRWKVRPEGSNWGDFGDDDQIGRMNLLTAERRLAGVREVKEGIAFTLSLPLDYPGGSEVALGRKPPRILPVSLGDGAPKYNFALSCVCDRFTDLVNDDVVELYTQYSTQWDSLAHVGSEFDATGDGTREPMFYNGFRPTDGVGLRPDGQTRAGVLGIENLATVGVQGRAVLVDLHRIYGRKAHRVGYEDLMRAMGDQKVSVQPGDFLCLYTGFGDILLEQKRQPNLRILHDTPALDGADAPLLQWITDSGLVAICCDNTAVEATSRKPRGTHRHAMLPLHEHCLFKQGIHLGELWHLSALAQWLRAHGRSSFLLTAPPLRLPGSVGSPVTPVATV